MLRRIQEIGAKANALDVWDQVAPFNWAVKPRGTVFPYFCSVLRGDQQLVKVRLLMLEGWQTLHEYVQVREDLDYGFCSTPVELPHFEMVVLMSGEIKFYRHDTGFVPIDVNERQCGLLEKILWETLGVMLRIESDHNLPMKFAKDQAIFARVEGLDGHWTDEPLVIPKPRAHVEEVVFPKDLVKKAVDLPIDTKTALDLDFRILPNVMTKELRPRCVYALVGVVAETGARAFESRVSVHPEGGLRGLWESMPVAVLSELVALGRVPAELRVRSKRVFRLLRPLCMELPIRLVMKDELPSLDPFYQARM